MSTARICSHPPRLSLRAKPGTGVICAYNEEGNIGRAVSLLGGAEGVGEVLVVDGHSEDRTVQRAEAAGARVVEQRPRMHPGKGAAVKTALAESDSGFLVFFDADIHNMRTGMVERLLRPVQAGEADHATATYRRKGGRVTELTARPLLRLLFPEVTLRQPLAGEFATRRDVLRSIPLEDGWGVESGMVVDLVMRGHRIQEVDLGVKEHDMKRLEDLHVMALQSAKAILGRAAAYGRLSRLEDHAALPVRP